MSHLSKKDDLTKKAQPEVINPLSIQKAGQGLEHHPVERHRHLTVMPFSIFLIAITTLGGWLFYYIKSNPTIANPTTASPVVESDRLPDPPASIPVDSNVPGNSAKEMQAEQKDRAERQRIKYSQAKATLEKMGVYIWGGSQYEEMMALGQEAEALFSQHEFDASTAQFTAALEKANLLSGDTQTVMNQLLEKGREAIAKGDGQMAQKYFQAALLIDPSNSVAQKSLERSKNTETVMRYIETGMVHERDGKFSLALTDYNKALMLDQEAELALAGRKRVEAIIDEAQFQHLMSVGQAALLISLAQARLTIVRQFIQIQQDIVVWGIIGPKSG